MNTADRRGRECLAVYGACVPGKARNGYRQCGNRRFASQNARKTLNHDLSNKNLTQQHKIAHDISAAISALHSGGVAQLSGILQRNIALPMYGLPQTALVRMNPLLMMLMLPAHSALQGQQSYNLDMSLLMAQANHASFVQQLNLQRARHSLQQQFFDNLNALTSGPPVGQAFDQRMGVPLGSASSSRAVFDRLHRTLQPLNPTIPVITQSHNKHCRAAAQTPTLLLKHFNFFRELARQ